MTIPAGVDSGQLLRLRGKGWRTPKGERTDLLVRVKIVTPKNLSSLEREYYEKLRQYQTFDPRQNIVNISL